MGSPSIHYQYQCRFNIVRYDFDLHIKIQIQQAHLTMEYYDKAQTQQLAPLIAVHLGSGGEGPLLKEHLEKSNVSNRVWDSSILKNRLLNAKHIIEYSETEELIYDRIEAHKAKTQQSHSPLSPFSAESDLFPNGILSARWFNKYGQDLPFAVIDVIQLQSDSSTDEDLGESLAALRVKYFNHGVKYIAIVVSSRAASADNDRIATLRQVSGLPRLSGLFYLNTEPSTVDRDCGILTSTIFSNLKVTATDFYSNIEHRIKQRHKKYYTFPAVKTETAVLLTPRFLEIRNLIKHAMISQFMHSHNVEPSLSILESSYEVLIELLRELALTFFEDSVSSHDIKLYGQFRCLLDVIAIHLIRGYFSIEEPIAALRKHGAHIANVIDLTKERPDIEKKIWVSIQYEWLAQLMTVVPTSVLADLNAVSKTKNKSNLKSITYFGGIRFHDNFSAEVVTQPPLVYFKAASQLVDLEHSATKLDYLQLFSNQSELKNNMIKLLDDAKSASYIVQKEGTLQAHESFENYLDWLIAEEYNQLGNFNEAIKSYQSILSNNYKSWTSICDIVSQKLLLIYEEMGDTQGILRTLTDLGTKDGSKNCSGFAIPKVALDSPDLEIFHDHGSNMLKLQVFVFNENLLSECHAFDTIVTQLKLQSCFDASVIEQAVPDCTVSVMVEKLELSYGNNVTVTLINGEKSASELQRVRINENSEATADLTDYNSGRFYQIYQEINDPGTHQVEIVKVFLKLTISVGKSTFTIIRNEIHPFGELAPQLHSVEIFIDDGTKKLIRQLGQSLAAIEVQPYRPDVTVEAISAVDFIIVGEKLDFPFQIAYKKPPNQNVNFSSLTLVLKAKVFENGTAIDSFAVQSNWSTLKDDEPLDILQMLTKESSEVNKLQLSVRRPPNNSIVHKNITLLLDLKLLVGESSGEISVYDLPSHELPVMMEPFGATFSVSPRCRADGVSDMPNPFVLSAGSDNPINDFSMPLPSRLWLAKFKLVDNLSLLGKEAIEIVRFQVNLRSRNAEVLVENEDDPSRDGLFLLQLFATRSKHRFTHRNVTVVASATFSWKRSGSESVNELETEEWDVVLPLQDPRVLLQTERLDENAVLFTYTMENPTPRILTFTTTLSGDVAAEQGTFWNFDDPKNILPLKQSAFPVLPFSRHQMKFHGTYRVEDEATKVELPQMQVYDVNYKVSLPTLSLSECVKTTEASLFMAK